MVIFILYQMIALGHFLCLFSCLLILLLWSHPFYRAIFFFFSPGESGLGKSTLLNSLFLTDIYTPAAYPSVEERLNKTVSVSLLLDVLYKFEAREK